MWIFLAVLLLMWRLGSAGLPIYDEYGQRLAKAPLSLALQGPDTASDKGALSLNATRQYWERWREDENITRFVI